MNDLKKSLNAGFYYQSIFIEYAIFEDRFSSMLKYANKPWKKKNGYDLDLKNKIGKVRSSPEFTGKYERSRLSLDLLDDIDAWRDLRNRKVHKLASLPYNAEEIKEIAVRGNELLKAFMNKAKSINNYHKKTIWKGEENE